MVSLKQFSGIACENIAIIGLFGLIAVTLLTIADVVLRWLFSAPIDGLNEITRLFYAVIMASFFPTALVHKNHISITFLGSALPSRLQLLLDKFGAFVTLVFFTVAAWQFIVFTEELFQAGEATWVLGWPVSPWWAVVTLLLIICVPVQIQVLGTGSKEVSSGEL